MTQTYDLILAGGTVVNQDGEGVRDVGVRLDGPAPEIGAPVQAGEIAIGAMGSSVGETGLAILRLDRAEEARAAGVALLCGATGIELIEAPTA